MPYPSAVDVPHPLVPQKGQSRVKSEGEPAFFSGLAFSFEIPCRQALISDIVDEQDVVGAVGLNSLAFNTAAVIGPALAGILILWVDEGAIFMLNGASYIAI